MNQLLMRLSGARAPFAIPALRIVDTSSPEFTREQFADGWAACCEALNGGLWAQEKFECEMRGDPKIKEDGILFAVLDGSLVATAAVQFGRACAYVPEWDYACSTTLHMVGARKGFTGLGAGLAVCAAAADYSLAHGVPTMYLTTDDFRLPAIKLYLNLGFCPVLYDGDQIARWQTIAASLARDLSCVTPGEEIVALTGITEK